MSRMAFRYEESRLDLDNREYIAESTEACVYGKQPGRIPIGDILAKFVEFLRGSGYNVDHIEIREKCVQTNNLIDNGN